MSRGWVEFAYYLCFLSLPALLMAMATACFSGLPAARSVAMLAEMVFWELPFLRGTDTS